MRFFATPHEAGRQPTVCWDWPRGWPSAVSSTSRGQRVGVLLSRRERGPGPLRRARSGACGSGRAAVSELQLISAEALGQPGGHYSHAACAGGLVFISGQLPITARGQRLSGEPFEVQVAQVLSNLDQVLTACGCGRTDLVQVRVYLLSVEDWPQFNTLYAEWIGEHRRRLRGAGAGASLRSGPGSRSGGPGQKSGVERTEVALPGCVPSQRHCLGRNGLSRSQMR